MSKIRHYQLVIGLILIVLLSGCSNDTVMEPEEKTLNENRSSPLYITPMIDGIGYCDESLQQNANIESASQAIEWCYDNGLEGASALEQVLNTFEPSGPEGNVQIGYEMGINLLGLYYKENGKWVIDDKKVDLYLNLIKNVNRPVVVYLMANHFDTKGDLPAELGEDINNLMVLKNGEPPSDDYFGNSVIPFTLLTDESIPVNKYRFEALRYVTKKLASLPEETKEKIVGITLAGEVHQLYPDFTNGAGEFENVLATDYSAKSIENFCSWLKDKYETIEKLNKALESNFTNFSDIQPPSKNIHKESLNSFTEHYDAYAGGKLPISGWLWDPKAKIDELTLYVDDKKVDEIQRGFNRLDVYQAVEHITDSNIGFRYDLDYTTLSPGHHNAQVVAESKGKQYLMGQVEFVVVDRNQGPSAPLSESKHKFKDFNELNGIEQWIDAPKPLTAVYYNPLAKEWNEFRDKQVTEFLTYFWSVAHESGLPEEKLFSHQILPMINSTWNTELFSGTDSINGEGPYNLGVNLYGGATNSDVFREFLKERNISEYGVPEYHIQQWKSENVSLDSLRAQYNDGARFISPYYISIIPESLKPFEKDSLQKFNIRPDNDLEGSNLFYDAIIEFAKQ